MMIERKIVPPEARMLMRTYALKKARKKYPGRVVDVVVNKYFNADGRVSRQVILADETVES